MLAPPTIFARMRPVRAPNACMRVAAAAGRRSTGTWRGCPGPATCRARQRACARARRCARRASCSAIATHEPRPTVASSVSSAARRRSPRPSRGSPPAGSRLPEDALAPFTAANRLRAAPSSVSTLPARESRPARARRGTARTALLRRAIEVDDHVAAGDQMRAAAGRRLVRAGRGARSAPATCTAGSSVCGGVVREVAPAQIAAACRRTPSSRERRRAPPPRGSRDRCRCRGSCTRASAVQRRRRCSACAMEERPRASTAPRPTSSPRSSTLMLGSGVGPERRHRPRRRSPRRSPSSGRAS